MNKEKQATLTEKLFLKEEELHEMEDYVYDQLLIAFDLQYIQDELLPFSGWTYSEYDYSFELYDVEEKWKPSKVQLNRCWEIGFKRCWIKYPEVDEYYTKEVTQ